MSTSKFLIASALAAGLASGCTETPPPTPAPAAVVTTPPAKGKKDPAKKNLGTFDAQKY